SELRTPTEVALGVMAEAHPSAALLARLDAVSETKAINVTAWKALALASAGRPLPQSAVTFLLRAQSRSGGWPWTPGVAPDSNDTAAVIEALRAASVDGRPVRRGLTYLRRLENRDGGFALTRGRGSVVAANISRFHGPQLVLEDVTFVVPGGARIGLVGPNGAGKSTLLRILAGLEEPDSGTVRRSPPGLTVGYLPQQSAEDSDLSG